MSPIKIDDTNFPVRFQSDLGGDLQLSSMTGEDQISHLFEYHLELVSENENLHFDDVVGLQVTTVLELRDGQRFFNGFITEFSYGGTDKDYTRYRATVRPWFWFLTRTTDCRIFQNMDVPAIIKQVFRDNGMKDFEERLSGQYRVWENCCQYRESDFNFISRLMEQEGIYYYFEHQAEGHVLVMADDIAAHQPFPNYENIPFYTGYKGVSKDYEDHLDIWTAKQYITPDKYAVRDFNFKTPKLKLLARSNEKTAHANPLADSEIYDYPGEYPKLENGSNYVKIRLQELQCKKETVQASGTCRGVSAGCLFALEDHPRKDQIKDYLVISVRHQIDNTEFRTEGSHEGEVYHCNIEVIDKTKPFRAARETPKPMVQGPQTAIVVGSSGDEIHTDEYGRVKVQFHWDRYGENDENSSCWVRVSQAWAGAKWGGIHIPRIGQEVIVSFMEGDPDRPIITGRVYNADLMPPYDLPGNKTQSGIKSRSSQGGSADNFNEFRFEDKKGSEEVYLHAEKNLTIKVESAESETVGASITTNAGASISRSAGADINRTADDNITDKAGKNITTESGENMKLTSGGSYELFTNLGIHIKAMNFVAALIESGAKDAAAALQKGGGGAAMATMTGGAGAGAAGAGAAAGAAVAALSPAIEAGVAELSSLSSDAAKAGEGVSDQAAAAGEKAAALSEAVASGASPEALGAAFMEFADAAMDAFDDAKKLIEGLFPQIPSIVLWAMKDINAHALWSMSLSTKVRDITIQAQSRDIHVNAKKNVNIGAETKDIQITGKENISIKAKDKNIVIEAGKEITLKCGKAEIILKEDGDITLKGKNIVNKTKSKFAVKASGAVSFKGSTVSEK